LIGYIGVVISLDFAEMFYQVKVGRCGNKLMGMSMFQQFSILIFSSEFATVAA
jgi:hypothetical protein